jgi:quercetin dioxygenase-like cupin family protein
MKIFDISEIPSTPTSHDIDVYKQTIIKNGEIPNLTGFGIAQLKSRQLISPHFHPTMYEVYYICKGSSLFKINDTEIELKSGQSLIIEPGETHSVKNSSNSDCEWLYFGIAID